MYLLLNILFVITLYFNCSVGKSFTELLFTFIDFENYKQTILFVHLNVRNKFEFSRTD